MTSDLQKAVFLGPYGALFLSALTAVVLLSGCEERRRPGGGTGNTNQNPNRDSGVRMDASEPVAVDGGFDDAGRPVDGGFTQADAGNNNNNLAMAQFCGEFVRIQCEANQRCCTGQGRFESIADCMSNVTFGWCFTGAAFDDGRAEFDAARAREMLDEFADLSSRCLVFAAKTLPVRGNVGAGGDCTVVEGQDPSPYFSCVEGTYCSGGEGSPSTCQNYLGLGQSCATGLCAPGTFCSSETTTCRMSQPIGGNCGELVADCAEGWCVDGVCTDTPRTDDYCWGE